MSTQQRKWNLWPLVPFIVIGVAVIPNTLKITNAQRYRAHQVEERPWEASRGFDQQRQASTAFAEAGLALEVHSHRDGQLQLELHADDPALLQRVEGLRVDLYRPDRPDWDRVLVWPTLSQGLSQGLSHKLDLSHLPGGAWVITVDGQLDGMDIRHSLRSHHYGQPTAARP